jgi:hypothetical protein
MEKGEVSFFSRFRKEGGNRKEPLDPGANWGGITIIVL